MVDRHDFMIHADGGLSRPAQQLPLVREHVRGLADTSATFTLTDIDGVQPQFFDSVHIELVRSWPVHEMYDTTDNRSNLFVNPNYVHAHSFTDFVVECECGAQFTRSYEDGRKALQQEHQHDEGCLPFDRLRARAAMQEQRYEAVQRLGWLGWKGTDMAPRFGIKDGGIGFIARDFNIDLRAQYDTYRQAAAKTYAHLVTEHDEPAKVVAEAYGHAPSTMTRWATKYTEYTTAHGQ